MRESGQEFIMTIHIQRVVAVTFLLVAAAGWTQESKDAALEVYAIGSEQRVLDSLEASTPEVSGPSGLNCLDSAYAAVMAKAYPKPDESLLAARTVTALCEEFRRQTGKELPTERCQSLAAAAAQAGGFENVLRELETESPDNLDRERLLQAGLAGMLSGPQPPAWLLGKDVAAQFKEMILARKEPKLEPGFVGLDLANWPTVMNVVPGGPAWEGGLRNGDVILRVEGVDISNVRSGVEAKNVLAGPVGSTMVVTVRRANQEMEFRLQRASRAATLVHAEALKPGILRISVPLLEGSGIAARFERLLADSREALQVLLLDLRGNPGGRLEEAHAIANLFLDEKLLEIFEFQGRRIAFRAAPGAAAVRVLVLVNGSTGSSAEILAMALRDNGAATIVGEPTAGMLFGKDMEPLEDGRALMIRIAPRILSPAGKDYTAGGVTPDIPAPDDRKGRDNILDRALRATTETWRPSPPGERQ
jgi:carboxyl-terminal processing protease